MDRSSLIWVLALCAWLSFVGIAIICGGLRVKLLEPMLGEAKAHVIGTLMVCLLLFAAMQLFVGASGLRDTWPLMRVGALWTVLTICFEFALGLVVLKKPVEELLADYNIFKGRLWVLVLVTTFWGPVWAGMLRG
ncbi:MAG: hypothetical protein HY916_10915 [Desulfovibrio sp.]|nr:hypothetical protein [Desulfovibrio sp.]